jgi:antitoxin ParD1/3/4
MATMNISLPDQMKEWVEAQAKDGRYSNSSDYVRDLIRRDVVRAEKIAHMQKLIDEGLASGFRAYEKGELKAEILKRAGVMADEL